MAPIASSIDSMDSYNGDDAWYYIHEWDEELGHHWEATQETKRLEATLTAFQTTLTAVEGESSHVPLSFGFVMLSLTLVLLSIALTEQLEALQLAAKNATGALNV